MREPNQYKYVEEYLDQLRSQGRYSFTSSDLKEKFNLSDEAVLKALQRIKRKRKAAMVRQEFYVIIPPEYSSRGMLPPTLFVADLMNFLQKDYYVGLLNAAVYYGASHQQPQEFYIVTTKPTLRPIKSRQLKINFCYKKQLSHADIIERKVETGFFRISSPELTALDIVFFFDRVGGFNRVITVLEELVSSIDAMKLAETARRFSQTAAVQRLGFLLDVVLNQQELIKPMKEVLTNVKHFPVLLRPQKEKPASMRTDNFWKVVRNIEIESEA